MIPDGSHSKNLAAMRERLIRKRLSHTPVEPYLTAYGVSRASFSWKMACEDLDGLPGGRGLNIAHEAVDRHARSARRDHVALLWLGKRDQVRRFTYGQLHELSARFANVLESLDIGKGDCVASLLGRIPELYIAALGTLRNRSVFCPLFSVFGPEPIKARMTIGKAKVIVTTEVLYGRKVEKIRGLLPELKHVLVVPESTPTEVPAGTHDFHNVLGAARAKHTIPATDPEDPALLHFTSGTTGKPKGAVHVHKAVVAHKVTAKLALDLHPEDVFWCTADPGWVTGTTYGIIAPLTIGATLITDEHAFDAERWYRVLQNQKVSVWYTAPTAIRMLMKMGRAIPDHYDFSSLRFLASVGEPLNPEAVYWGLDAFGLPFHDNWWQTETGAIMIANYAAMDIKPGSMGRPLPGIEAAVVRRKTQGELEILKAPSAQGELALRAGWPSMFRDYLSEQERYRRCFSQGWYLTGDLARRDTEGYYWFIGRADDVIKSAGHLIGPFEVESVLMEHPAVAEAGAIGKPDPVVMETVKAFVVLKPGHQGDAMLQRELLAHARKRLGAAVAPKEIEFRRSLPKTRSGKIMRRLLKAEELGLSEGDVSTLGADP
jgi:acetyl-CoA synthetase